MNFKKIAFFIFTISFFSCSESEITQVNESNIIQSENQEDTIAGLPEIKEGMVLHFGYGSNLNEEFMKKYCPGLEFYTTAKLYNYKIYFPYYSANYKGGLSGILQEPGEIVYGAVYQIPENEILDLDTLEGVPDNEYKRETFWVEAFNGEKIRADIYRVVEPKGPFTPSIKYLDILIDGAKSRNFPEEYINRFIELQEETKVLQDTL